MNTTKLAPHKPFPSTVALIDALQLEDNASRTVEDVVDELDSEPTVNHMVRSSRITRSIVYGVPVTALCGDRFVFQSQGGGRTDAPEALLCPICEWLYNQMKAE